MGSALGRAAAFLGSGHRGAWGSQPRQVTRGLRGYVPILLGLTNLPLAASELTHPLSHQSLRPSVSCPCCHSSTSLPPSPTEPLLSLLLQAMAFGIARVLTVLCILQYQLRVGDPTDATTQDLLQQYAEQQRQQMAQLWEEAELRGQEPPGLAQESVLFAVLHQWWFWVSADILLMLFGLYWLPRQRSNDSESDSQDGSSSSAEEEWKEDDWENEPDPYCTLGQDKSRDKVRTCSAFAKPFPGPAF